MSLWFILKHTFIYIYMYFKNVYMQLVRGLKDFMGFIIGL